MINRLFPLAVLLVIESSAQEFRATLHGTITDPSRAHIAGASLLLKHTATGVERTAAADDAGHYVFQFLPPGTYALTTRAPGFKTDIREEVQLSLGDNLRLDVELAIGQANETVTVTGDAATVQAESSSLGSVVRKEIIDTLPLK